VHLQNGREGIVDLRLLNALFVGDLFRDHITHLVVSGRWSSLTAHLPIGFLAGGDGETACAIAHALPIGIEPPLATSGPLSPDVMSTLATAYANPPALCEAVSVGLALELVRAQATRTIACAQPGPRDLEPDCGRD
jgi:hypothetical protein